MNDTDRKNTIAMIHLGTWGSQSTPPVRWEQWEHVETDYAPEWLSESDLGCDHDQCVTVLDYSLGDPTIPEGYRVAYQYQAGEHECPDCHKRQPGDREDYEGQPLQSECQLCEGNGVIYSGEECVVLVLAPRYSYGSGSAGCLYDSGPDFATSIDAAVEALAERFSDVEEEGWTEALKADGIYRFKDPAAAGADYCEIVDLNS